VSNRQIQQQPGGRDFVQESQGTVAGGGKLAPKVGKRTVLIAAAGGTALVAFLMARSGGGGGGGGGSAQQMTGYDSTPYDQYNELQRQLENIQDQMDNGKVTPAQPTTPTPTPTSPKPPRVTLPWPVPHPRPLPGHTTLPQPTGKPPIKKPPVKRPPSKGKWYTIKKGDTLSEIASRNHTSMSVIKKLNPNFWSNPKYHDGNTIWAGGKVRLK
jgi:hypothetical protein